MSFSSSRFALAAIGFLFHAPALVYLGYRFNRRTIVLNLIAGGATIATTATTFLLTPEGERLVPCLIAWFSGHFAWSGYLAWAVLTERAKRIESWIRD